MAWIDQAQRNVLRHQQSPAPRNAGWASHWAHWGCSRCTSWSVSSKYWLDHSEYSKTGEKPPKDQRYIHNPRRFCQSFRTVKCCQKDKKFQLLSCSSWTTAVSCSCWTGPDCTSRSGSETTLFEFKIAPTFLRWPRHFYESINRLLGHAFQGIIKENLYNSKNSRNPLQLPKTSCSFKEKLCLNYSKHSPIETVRHCLTFGEFLQRVLMALSSLYPSIIR